jgi:hypothetical protein
MDAEISLIHRHIRPNARDQLAMSDDFASPPNQSDQRVERTASSWSGSFPFMSGLSATNSRKGPNETDSGGIA